MGVAMPIAQVAMAAYGAYSAKKAGDEQKKQLRRQNAMGNEAAGMGRNFYNQSQQAYGPAMNHYRQLASANPLAVREAIAPEMNAMTDQYRNAYNSARTLHGRGGMSANQASQMPFDLAGKQTNMMYSARNNAAQQLAGMGGQLGGLGFQGFGMGAGIHQNLFQNTLAARQQQYQEGAGAGESLFNAYQNWVQNRPDQTAPGAQVGQGLNSSNWMNLGKGDPRAFGDIGNGAVSNSIGGSSGFYTSGGK
jgi:hypothetical protein